MVEVAIGRAHIDDRAQASAVACGEAALIEVYILHHIGVE